MGRLPASELLVDVWLRDELAPDLLRRRRLAEAPLRHDQPDGPPRRRDLGPRLRRRPDRDAPGARREVPRRQDRAARRDQGARPEPCRGAHSRSRGSAPTRAASSTTTSRSRSMADRGTTGSSNEGDERHVHRRRRTRLRIPRPGPATSHGNTGAWDVTSVYLPHVDPDAAATSARSSPRASTSVRRPDTAAPIVTTAAAGTILAITGGPVSAERLHAGTRSRCRSLSGRRSPASGPMSGSLPATSGATYRRPRHAPRTRPSSTCPPASPRPRAPGSSGSILPASSTRAPGSALGGTFASGDAQDVRRSGASRGVPLERGRGHRNADGRRPVERGLREPRAIRGNGRPLLGRQHPERRCPGVPASPSSSAPTDHWPRSGPGAGGSKTSLDLRRERLLRPGRELAATFTPLTPARVLDTRNGNGLTGLFTSERTSVLRSSRGRGGVPAGAVAVTGNLTVVGAVERRTTSTSGRLPRRRRPARASTSLGATSGRRR